MEQKWKKSSRSWAHLPPWLGQQRSREVGIYCNGVSELGDTPVERWWAVVYPSHWPTHWNNAQGGRIQSKNELCPYQRVQLAVFSLCQRLQADFSLYWNIISVIKPTTINCIQLSTLCELATQTLCFWGCELGHTHKTQQQCSINVLEELGSTQAYLCMK